MQQQQTTADIFAEHNAKTIDEFPFGSVHFETGFRRGIEAKRARGANSIPLRLKSHCKHDACGTAEAVPLSKNGFLQQPLKSRST
jgi:hypothetical protein